MIRQANSDLGPADLVLLLKMDTGLSREDVCSLLGYPTPELRVESVTKKVTGKKNEIAATNQTSVAESLQVQPVIGGFRPKFWQLLSLQSKETVGLAAELALAGGEQIATVASQTQTRLRERKRLPSPALLHNRALWSRASRAAQCAAHAQQQELQQWLAALSRAETPARPALQQETQESGEIWLIMDYHPRLMLWWDELNRVGAALHQRFGRSRARLIPLLHQDLSELSTNAGLPWPGKQTRLLVFSDLGLLSGSVQRRQWQAVLQRWNEAGVQISVFIPHTRPAQAFYQLTDNRLLLWDQTVQETNKNILEDLLACLSMVQWCSPVLLRCWRRLLHGRVEHEYKLWHQPQVWHQPGACGLQTGIDLARDRFAAFKPELRQRLLAATDEHRAFISREALLEEAAIRHSMGLDAETTLLDEMRRLTTSMQSRGTLSEATQRWLWRLSNRQCRRFWESNPELEQLCISSRKQLNKRAVAVPLGPGMSATRMQSDGSPVRLSVQAVGEALQLVDIDSSTTTGSAVELAQIESGTDELEFGYDEHDGPFPTPAGILRLGKPLPNYGDKFQYLRLASDRQTCQLRQVEKPPWATAMEQGPDGLYCSLPDGRCLRWCYPEEFIPRERQTLRLRWVPPGEFRMGSAEDEPERDDDERQHRAILTRGYWLAETVCSQGLWQAVMGENPSHFKGEDLPVEQVSWNDAREFCQRLNERLPGLQARLPSEAEWEYTCRAGTETPFWWGSELSPEQANYHGEYQYNNGQKGEYRQKTLPVNHFDPNPWGLYQMHGNVDEWCEDWYADYPDGDVQIDPIGPERGLSRVRRGGSWYSDGWWLRAADRDYRTPDDRDDWLGFRLAAGPRPGGAEEIEVDGESAAEGNGRQVIAPTTAPALF